MGEVAAIYARVSTDEQAEHGTSLDEQVRLCRQRLQPGQEARVFIDAGLSGTTLERPQLQAVVDGARRGMFGRLIAYDPDRLSRNAAHLLLLVDELRAAGIVVEFVNFTTDLSPDGRLLFTVRGAISEFEAHRIKQRLYSGKQARARANQVSAGTCIYGYRLDRVTKQWELEPREAQVVRLLFEWAAEAGTWELARRLNADEVPARFGGRWSPSSVAGILRNPTYLGRMPQMGGLGSVPVPVLVNPEQFERVQAARTARLTRPTGRPTHPYLLTGRLRCAACGRSMCGGYGRPTRSGVTTYYGCPARAKPAPDGERCGNRYWRSDLMDAQVWRHVFACVGDAEAMRAVCAEPVGDVRRMEDLDSQLRAIERDRGRLRREWERVLGAFRRGLIAERDLEAQQRELGAEARVLDQRQEAVDAQCRAAAPQAEGGGEAVLRRMLADAPRLEGAQVRRDVLAALGVRASVSPSGEIEVRLGVPES